MKATVFLGIDISKDSFDAALYDEVETLLWKDKFQMTRSGFEALTQKLSPYERCIVGMESTGIYHVNLFVYLLEKSIPTKLLNPSLVKRFIESYSLRKTKTDAKDARMIALYLIRNHETLNTLSQDACFELSRLSRTREEINKQIRRTKSHIKRLLITTFPELEKRVNVFSKTMLLLFKQFPSARAVQSSRARGVRKAFDVILSERGRRISLTADEFIQMAKDSIASGCECDENALRYHIEHLFFLEKHLDDLTKELIIQTEK